MPLLTELIVAVQAETKEIAAMSTFATREIKQKQQTISE